MLRLVEGIAIMHNGEWWVRVQDESHPQNNMELPVASIHEGITLAEGLYVEFLVGLIDGGKKGKVFSAIDVRPVQPLPSTEEILNRQDNSQPQRSILWDIVAKIQQEVGGQDLNPTEQDSLAGSGGQRHRYLQQVVKHLGEKLGFRAIVEKPIVANGIRIDVVLEKEELAIACEISVTHISEEPEKIKKILAAGYQYIIFISTERGILRRIENRVCKRISPEEQVQFFLPEELPHFLEKLVAPLPSEETVVKGWKVRTVWVTVSPERSQQIRETVGGILAQACCREKQKSPIS